MGIRIRRRAEAVWRGAVESGAGRIAVGSRAFEGPYSLKSRTEEAPHTNPEELLGAAHAACFAMSVANLVGEAGGEPRDIDAQAAVTLEESDGSFSVTRIDLALVATVSGLDEATVTSLAEQAKATCPISRALAGTEIALTVRFVNADDQPASTSPGRS